MNAGDLPDELKAYLESLKPPPLTADELAESIPPVYTEYIGSQLLKAV